MERNEKSRLISLERLFRLFIYENKSTLYYAKITACIIIYAIYFILVYDIIETTISTAIFIWVSPFLFYGDILSKRRRTLYISLPASNIEKYLSILLNTLFIAPLAVIAIMYVIKLIYSVIFTHAHHIETETSPTNILLHMVFVLGITSICTYLLIIYKTSSVLKSIVYTTVIATAEYLFMNLILKILFDGYIAPSHIIYSNAIFGVCNIIVTQILIYHTIKRIKA